MRERNTSHVGSAFARNFLRNIESGKIIVETEPGLTAGIVSKTLSDVDIIVRAARAKTDRVLAEKTPPNMIRKLYEPQGGSFV